ncbi:MAG: addiction module protein [Nitrospira sp.]|nr:addiction module protein [Nitrospira sp.]
MADDLRTLPIDERMQLVEDIWDSIAADQAALPLTDEQRVELDRRLDAYETDNIKGREASDVVTALKKRL